MMMIENLFGEIVVHFSESIIQVNKRDDNRALFYACLIVIIIIIIIIINFLALLLFRVKNASVQIYLCYFTIIVRSINPENSLGD